MAPSLTAISSLPDELADLAGELEGSAGMLNVEHLCKAEEGIGQAQQRCGHHDVDDRYCRLGMGHHQWREKHGLEHSFAAKLIALERKRERRSRHERNRGRPRGDDQAVAKAGLKVLIRDRLDKPAPRPALRRKGQYRPAVEG